ncbi:hypothetical protein B0T21DRAFT_359399 [Apiosordaria backusii]|uniref:Uncharacterized protein n=1 Tax=Apiosordaria backusii TaxID=314023 RepID=A0AA40ETV5_9PEZI|nr:hypothetical protein B0T21DRAFT_359399 [Apiosordaria backusii]
MIIYTLNSLFACLLHNVSGYVSHYSKQEKGESRGHDVCSLECVRPGCVTHGTGVCEYRTSPTDIYLGSLPHPTSREPQYPATIFQLSMIGIETAAHQLTTASSSSAPSPMFGEVLPRAGSEGVRLGVGLIESNPTDNGA